MIRPPQPEQLPLFPTGLPSTHDQRPREMILAPPQLWATLPPAAQQQLRRAILQIVREVLGHAERI